MPGNFRNYYMQGMAFKIYFYQGAPAFKFRVRRKARNKFLKAFITGQSEGLLFQPAYYHYCQRL